MLNGQVDFDSKVSTELVKFAANPNQTYRAAILPFLNEEKQLKAIIRGFRCHWHDAEDGLKSFFCLSTDDYTAPCCDHTEYFGDANFKAAIPIILYSTSKSGAVLKNEEGGVDAELQILVASKTAFQKLQNINKSYPLVSTDFTITGKKLNRGVQLDFTPAGNSAWIEDSVSKKFWVKEGRRVNTASVLASLDRMLGKPVTEAQIKMAIRAEMGEDVDELPAFKGKFNDDDELPAKSSGKTQKEAIADIEDD